MSGRASRPAALVLSVGLGVALVACGPASPIESPTPSALPEPTPVVTTYGLDTTVWYAGLVMRFGTATADLDAHGGRLRIEVLIENPQTDDITLTASIRVVVAGETFEPTRESVLPTILAGSTAFTTLKYELVGVPSLDGAVVRVGDPGEHQGIVPLTAGKAVTLTPTKLKVSGTATTSDLRVTLRAATLRWDLPDWAEELPSQSAALILTYDVTYRGTFGGGYPFTGSNIALRLPDGTVIRSRSDGRSQSVALLGPGRTVKGLSSRFEIPAGVPGTYVLLIRGGGAEAPIRFAIPG